ncbi:hypothetical protein GGI43DRAFT_418528 [Trichoderma evansii]
MVTEEQQRIREAIQRRRVLYLLSYTSCCFNLVVLICIILLATAGTAYTAWGCQGPALWEFGSEALIYREFALVQFSTNISSSSPTLYWFLDAFGWQLMTDGQAHSAAWTYRGVGKTLRFPSVMNSFFRGFNSTVNTDFWESCTFSAHAEPTCVLKYDNKSIAGFDAAPRYDAPTAPAFTFYVLTAALTSFILTVNLIFPYTPAYTNRRRHTLWLLTSEPSLLAIYTIIPGIHLVAAACVTAVATQVLNYLHNIPELADLVWNLSIGSGFMRLVWLGFTATVLGSLTSCSRLWLNRRWRATTEWEIVLALAGIRYDGNRQPRTTQAAVERRPSEHTSIRTQLPKYER